MTTARVDWISLSPIPTPGMEALVESLAQCLRENSLDAEDRLGVWATQSLQWGETADVVDVVAWKGATLKEDPGEELDHAFDEWAEKTRTHDTPAPWILVVQSPQNQGVFAWARHGSTVQGLFIGSKELNHPSDEEAVLRAACNHLAGLTHEPSLAPMRALLANRALDHALPAAPTSRGPRF